MSWTIPSDHWRDEMLLLRDATGLAFDAAWALLKKHDSAEAAFEEFCNG